MQPAVSGTTYASVQSEAQSVQSRHMYVSPMPVSSRSSSISAFSVKGPVMTRCHSCCHIASVMLRQASDGVVILYNPHSCYPAMMFSSLCLQMRTPGGAPLLSPLALHAINEKNTATSVTPMSARSHSTFKAGLPKPAPASNRAGGTYRGSTSPPQAAVAGAARTGTGRWAISCI